LKSKKGCPIQHHEAEELRRKKGLPTYSVGGKRRARKTHLSQGAYRAKVDRKGSLRTNSGRREGAKDSHMRRKRGKPILKGQKFSPNHCGSRGKNKLEPGAQVVSRTQIRGDVLIIRGSRWSKGGGKERRKKAPVRKGHKNRLRGSNKNTISRRKKPLVRRL